MICKAVLAKLQQAHAHRFIVIITSVVFVLCLFYYFFTINDTSSYQYRGRFLSYEDQRIDSEVVSEDVPLLDYGGIRTENGTVKGQVLPDSLRALQANFFSFPLKLESMPTRTADTVNSIGRWMRRSNAFNGTYISPNIVVLGLSNLKEHHRFAIFSSDSLSRDYKYAFLLPLTTLAWRRVQYGSIVLIVGEQQTWASVPVLEHILRSTLAKGAVVVFLEGVTSRHAVMLSQCSRLFAANILSTAVDLNSTVFVTSDADLWPIRSEPFSLNTTNDSPSVVSLNSFCCAPFAHKGRKHRMLPLANIIASAATWESLTAQRGNPPRTSNDIIAYMEREFGDLARNSVHKGENRGWFMDQHLLSLLLEDWQSTHGNASVRLVGRDVGHDRIDENHWSPWLLNGIQDVHVLQATYRETTWRQVQPILRLMYVSGDYPWCEMYRRSFLELYAPTVH